MINTTMKNDIKGTPASIPHGRIVGQPSSKNLINTTVTKPSCKADNFDYSVGSAKEVNGGPTHVFGASKGKQA